MTDLGKLRHGEDFAARLLRAGVGDAPPHEARRRAATALGLSLATSGTAGLAASLLPATASGATSVAKIGIVALARWFGAGVLAGATVFSGVAVVGRSTVRPEDAASHAAAPSKTSPGREVGRPRSADTQTEREALPVTPEAAAAALPRVTTTAPAPAGQPAQTLADPQESVPPAAVAAPAGNLAPSALSREIALLERVRAKVRAGDGHGALAELDAIQAEVHTLAMEAELLRAEALLQTGERKRAEALARELERRYPRGSHTFRLKRLLSAP